MKNKKGITLIALVITIVILLILAGVTIILLLGNNGIVNKAQYARDNYQNAVDEEKQQTENLEDFFDNNYVSNESIESTPELEKFEGNIGIIKISAIDDKNKIIAYSVTDDIDKDDFVNWDGKEITINVENNKILFLKVKNSFGNVISKKFQIHEHQGNLNEEGACYNIPIYHVHTGLQTNGTGCYTKRDVTSTFNEINFYKAVPKSGVTVSALSYSSNSISTYYQDQTTDNPIYSSKNKLSYESSYLTCATGFHTTEAAAMNKATQVSNVFYTSDKNNSKYYSSIDSSPSYTYYVRESTVSYSLGCEKDENTIENYQINCEYQNGELIVY